MGANKTQIKTTFKVGLICISAYLVRYCVSGLLSVFTPGMVASGEFTKEFIGTLSSVYMLVYAIGQLVNGYLGDRIKPKFMVSIGLLLCGTSSLLFSVIDSRFLQTLVFGLMGFSLSMLRGPLVKTICENMKSEHAHICCVFLSFTGFVGPLTASLLSMIFAWNTAFAIAGSVCIAFSLVFFVVLTYYEKKKVILYRIKESKTAKQTKSGGILGLFKLENFFVYMLVGMVCEIAGSSISFWIPTYLTERLGYSAEISGILYTVITLIKAFTPFIAIFVLKAMKNKDIKMMRYAFLIATVLFVGVFFITNKYLNIVFLLLALMAVRSSSTLLWSVYIPNQSKSGLVSTLNGFLDFSGYVAASAANMLFSFTMSSVGWDGIVIMWIVLVGFGFAVSVAARKRKV